MQRAWFALVLMALPAVFLSGARGATPEEIFALYARGDYAQAARSGEAAHSAPGYAIAARAVLADAVLRDKPCLECLQRAESLARAGIAANPHHAFSQVWLAVALGYQSRITGIVKARLRNAPAESRAALDQAVDDDPRNAYAISALGGWHIEVVRGGGAFLARTLYGARESDGLALFDRAVQLDPGNVAVRYQIALSLLGFDAEKYRSRIVTELRAALNDHADTAYEKAMQERASDLLGLVNHGPRPALEARVRQYQGYPD